MAHFYEKELVDKELWPLGEDLRERFEKTKQLLLKVQSHKDLLGGPESQLLRQKLALRGPYVTPLNVLQVPGISKAQLGISTRVCNAFPCLV